VLAFRDINPQAPTHILVIPKKKDGLAGLENAEDRHEHILGKLMVAVAKIARQEKLDEGYRVVINNGKHGGQEVRHLHIHLFGGKQCTWPPGTSK
jgi:histidine triad (HIT) family protein